MHSLVFLAMLRACWGELKKKRSFSLTIDLGTKGLWWVSAVDSCEDDGARGEGAGREGSAHVIRVTLRSFRQPWSALCWAASMPQISPVPGRDCGNQRAEKTQRFMLIFT